MVEYTPKASEIILARLRDEAKAMDRPEIRLRTLNRLTQACEDIASGRAANIVKAAYGKDFGLGLNPKITPSSIDRYVRARRAKDDSWSGPTRAFIHNDPGILSFVKACEDERQKPLLPRRPSPPRRRLEEAIETIPSADDRQFVRLEVERLRKTRNELELLRKGLRKIAPIDIDKILEGGVADALGNNGPLIEILAPLVARFLDEEEMSRIGLVLVNGRLACRTTHQTLVKKMEMEALKVATGQQR